MKNILAALLILAIAAAFVSGYLLGSPVPAAEKQTQARPAVAAQEESSATIYVPAVDENGNGVALQLTVRREAGNGEILIDINSLLFWFDTQKSIQTARDVAQNLTGADTGGINLVYMIDTNASLVGGPSAGAALAMATIAALENKSLNSSIMITGTINPDGTIGQVGGILEKAKTAKQAGAKLFLVPKGQGTETFLKPEEKCAENRRFVYCETRYRQVVTDISESAGIPVKEVSTIADAEKYFFA